MELLADSELLVVIMESRPLSHSEEKDVGDTDGALLRKLEEFKQPEGEYGIT